MDERQAAAEAAIGAGSNHSGDARIIRQHVASQRIVGDLGQGMIALGAAAYTAAIAFAKFQKVYRRRK
jgi:hypothetical protein